jgi:hypothetical protein
MSVDYDPFRGYGTTTEQHDDDLDELTRAQLVERAAELGLSTKGTKADLAARIRAQQ